VGSDLSFALKEGEAPSGRLEDYSNPASANENGSPCPTMM
jgi:hypothetical protein